MKKNLLLLILVFCTVCTVCTVIVSAQQLRNWPIYSIHGPGPALSNFAYTGGPPTGYNYSTYAYSIPPVAVICSNAYYDTKNNLVLYVVQTEEQCKDGYKVYIYDQAGNVIPSCVTTNDTCDITASATTEINIIPVPSCEEKLFHIIVGNKLLVVDMRDPAAGNRVIHQAALFGSGIRMNSGGAVGAVRTTPTAVWIKDKNSYFVYAFANNNPGISNTILTKTEISFTACTDEYKCGEGNYILVEGSSPYIKRNSLDNQIVTSLSLGTGGVFAPYICHFSTLLSEIELSADGRHLLFNDNDKVIILNFNDADDPDIAGSLSGYELYDIPDSGGWNKYSVSGLEFGKNLQYVYYTIYDNRYSPLFSASQPSEALIRVDLTKGITTPINGTQQYARSQLETGMDDNIYMLWSGGIDYIDHLTNTVTPYLDFSTLGGSVNNVLLNASPYNTLMATYMELYTLPDQIDGQSFDNGYFGNPIITSHQYTICKPEDLYLKTSFYKCHLPSDSMPSWYICTNSSEENYELCNYDSIHKGQSYHVSGALLTQKGSLTFKSEYTDPYGCTYIDYFNVNAPAYTTEVIEKYACYNESVILPEPSCDGEVSWFVGDIEDLYETPSVQNGHDYTLYSLSYNITVTALCRDENACVTKKLVYHITVSQPALSSEIIVDACQGETVDMALVVPSGCRMQYPPLTVIATTSRPYFYSCLDERGCPINNLKVNLNVLPTTIDEVSIDVACGSMLDLSVWACNSGGINQWYKDDADNPGHFTELPSSWVVVGENSTFLCVSKAPCCRRTIHVSLLAPDMFVVPIEVCEGELIDIASYLPQGCSWDLSIAPLTATTSQTLIYTCTDSFFGCVRSFTQLNITVRPNSFHEETFIVNCGDLVDLNNLAPHGGSFCEGGTNWAYLENGEYVSVFNTVFHLTTPKTLYGFGIADPCCRVIIHFEIRQVQETIYNLCDNPDIEVEPCDDGTTAQWTKDGVPYMWTGTFTGTGEYLQRCINDETGCIVRARRYIVNEELCDVVYLCLQPGLLLANPCADGQTVLWTKDGFPIPGSGDITVSLSGIYDVTCLSPEGAIMFKRKYVVRPCEGAPRQSFSTGLKSADDQHFISTFPNPFSSYVTIQLNGISTDHIDVTDVLGRTVYEQHTKSMSNFVIDTKKWNAGTYLISFYRGSELIRVQKILKAN